MKKLNWLTICLAIVFSVFVNLLFGRWISAKVSTWPLLNRWKILSPSAPIVINTREEVRISDTGDVLSAISEARPKISTVISTQNGQVNVLGGAINLTSDGVFVTALGVFSGNLLNYSVLLDDGTAAVISERLADPGTGVVFFKAKLNNVPVAGLGDSKALRTGEKVLFLSNSAENYQTKYLGSFVSFTQTDIARQIFDTDHPSRTFGLQPVGPLVPGSAVVNIKGEVAGIFTDSGVVSSDVLKPALNLYLAGQNKIARPQFGFSYAVLTANESKLLNLPAGALVKTVSAASPAAKAGLQNGDIITAINGDKISQDQLPEELLQKYKQGDILSLEVSRGKDRLRLALTAGELK